MTLFCAAVFAAENGSFRKYRKTVKRGGVGCTGDGIGQDLIIEGHIDAVMVPVKGHRFHIDIGVHKFGAADADIGGSIQDLLGGSG